VKGASVSVKQGEIVGLLGPNGAGKTTTFYMITGMIRPTEGRVFIDDKDITRMPMYKRSRLGFGYLPQEASMFRQLTVEDNLLATLEVMGYTTGSNVRSAPRNCSGISTSSIFARARATCCPAASGGGRRSHVH
jgi:lipopolysaccharide export system ATP-binding protein